MGHHHQKVRASSHTSTKWVLHSMQFNYSINTTTRQVFNLVVDLDIDSNDSFHDEF
jgi:hypothetical protein